MKAKSMRTRKVIRKKLYGEQAKVEPSDLDRPAWKRGKSARKNGKREF